MLNGLLHRAGCNLLMEITDIWPEIASATHAAFRTFIPRPSTRIHITWSTFPYTLIHIIPLIFMSYLVRRPGTHLIRLLLLPTVISFTLRACFGYMWSSPELNVFNWGEGLVALLLIGKALDFAFTKDGRKRLAEKQPGDIQLHVSQNEFTPSNGHAKEVSKDQKINSIFPVWFQDAVDVLASMRGIGWDFGEDVHIPPEFRSIERKAFLRETFSLAVIDFLAVDFLESCFKLIPGVGSPQGGSIFFSSLPPLYRYTVSTAIHIATGTAFLYGFCMVYYLITVICVGVLGSPPTSWPPLFDNPWISESLHEFWAKRWHQILRRTFLIYGGFPCQYLLGKVGLLFGAFIASGLFHECAMYAMGRGWDDRVMLFFLAQGVGVLLERLWKLISGHRVGGWPGIVWVYFCIMVLGQPCIDAWLTRGLAGGLIIPPRISPTRMLLWPLISNITGINLSRISTDIILE